MLSPPVFYEPNFVDNVDEAFKILSTELQWVERVSARQEYYCNDTLISYVYGTGKGQREYQVQPWHPTILAIRKQVEDMIHEKMDVCFLNRYLNQSNALGWHADDSPEMDDERSIAVVSLGAEREIWFRPALKNNLCKTCGNKKEDFHRDHCAGDFSGTLIIDHIEKIKLGHGSVAVMAPGMQDIWQHRIPKCDRQCGERISLTFRGYVKPSE